MARGIIIAGLSFFGMLALAVGAALDDRRPSVASSGHQDEPVVYPAELEEAA